MRFNDMQHGTHQVLLACRPRSLVSTPLPRVHSTHIPPLKRADPLQIPPPPEPQTSPQSLFPLRRASIAAPIPSKKQPRHRTPSGKPFRPKKPGEPHGCAPASPPKVQARSSEPEVQQRLANLASVSRGADLVKWTEVPRKPVAPSQVSEPGRQARGGILVSFLDVLGLHLAAAPRGRGG